MKRILITTFLLFCFGNILLFGQMVTVLSPNGGESLSAGSIYTIEWVSYGSTSMVDLYYSTDGGGTWIFINDNLPISGTYAWTVPNVSSTTCLVKAQSIYVDQSNAYFTIAAADPISIVFPNGGEVLQGGGNYDITWTSNGSITWLDLYYSTDGGITWTFIADHEANDASFTWTVPNIASTNMKVMITEFNNTNIYDISDTDFSIDSVSNSVTVLSPNGGENLVIGSVHNITWSTTGSISYVEIYYSTDGGMIWNYIDDYSLNDGQYEWTVPNVSTINALIKINDVFNTSVIDVSDSLFEISTPVPNTITVNAPNGGEILAGGSTSNITWSTSGNISFVEIWYSTDSGNIWNYIDDHATNDGQFEWMVPNVSSTSVLIKINEFGNTSVVDVSNSIFTINAVSNSVTVIAPNGGEILTVGSTQNISWSTTGSISYVEIYYSPDGGMLWNYIDDYSPNDGSYDWVVPNIPTTNALIKIHEVLNSSVSDISNAVFEIVVPIPNPVTVASPNGGEVLSGGSTYDITWSSDGTVSWLDLYYSLDGGITWTFIADHEANDGTYSWNVTNTTTSSAMIMITEFANTNIYDISDSVFSINAVANSVTVVAPNGGEVLSAGTVYNILWTTTGTFTYGAVEVWYSTDGGIVWSYIDDYATNDGQLEWTVPTVATTNALIKINEVYNTSVVDVSDSAFEISTAVSNTITLLAPNGGEILAGGSISNITWSTSGNISFVEIWYSTDYGNNWNYIDDHATNDGQFEWNVPNVSSNSTLIKINEFGNTSIVDYSNSVFTINAVPLSITIVAPNGGESWTVGSTQNITWTTTGSISNVEIWYSTNGGMQWDYIDDYSPNDGLYEWSVPNIPTLNALIKINDVYNYSVSDVSNAAFEISNVISNSITVLTPNGGELFNTGDTVDISWSTTGTIAYVEIWYSSDFGNTWNYIDDHSVNDGLYEWTAPNLSSTGALIKINEFGNNSVVDLSDYEFTIVPVLNTITVLTPNGSEVWQAGSSYDITWATTGTILNVEIWYSIDAGSNWLYIDDMSLNDGLYEWIVPSISTQSGLIKINDVANSSVVDQCDTVFEISTVPPGPFTVITPNGGEVLTGGSTYSITWSTNGSYTYVGILYSLDGGTTWGVVDDFHYNNGFKEWTVVNTSSTNAIIKVHEVFNSTNGDVSDAPFTINAIPNNISVISPNGGELLSGGSTHNITWSTTGQINYVEIWYSTDAGINWNYIDDYSLNDGLYEWSVPNVASTSALIKINEVYNTSVVDVSDATFSIDEIIPLSVTSPNGGEIISGSSTYDITWVGIPSISYVDLYYSTDGGSNWVIITDHEINDSIYSWTVPNVTTSNAMIGISDFNNSNNWDVSDAAFTINSVSNSITVSTPNGGEVWTAGSTQNITWSSTGTISFVEIWYSIDSGVNWNYIDDYSANDGLYEWNVPTTSTLNALIKINDVYSASVVDVSNSTFEISSSVSNSLTIITPNGGEQLSGGDSYNITWNSTGAISYVEIWYSLDYGNTWNYIDDHSLNDGLYLWTVPNTTTNGALIKINEFGNSSVSDYSDFNFSINSQTNSITVISPNGSEVWAAGSSQNITWTSTGSISYVEIWYSTDNGVSWSYIDDYSPNDGFYEWIVPTVASSNTLIKIVDVSNNSVLDVSDNTFEISIPDSITVLTPNGGELLSGGSTYDITWTSTGTISFVEIWYSSDGGTNWSYIDDHATNDGIFEWSVPNVNALNALIKINAFSNSLIVDESNSVFEIVQVVSNITVTYPNGGDSLTMGATYYINWNTIGTVGNVDLSYSMDAGVTWVSIASNVANNGLHPWSLPNSTSSMTLVRVSEYGNPALMDESDSTFDIISTLINSITIFSPNGGESFTGGNYYQISYYAVGMIQFIKVLYSTDGGVNWIISSEYENNNGNISWQAPAINSQSVLLRLEDQFNPTVGDNSDNTFEIITPIVNSLTLISPYGTEVWAPGTVHDILWSSTGNISHVEIFYSIDGGVTWLYVDDYTPNDGVYEWTVPNVSTTNARVKINDVFDISVWDVSSYDFEISTATTLTVISPNGGELLSVGSNYEITWTSFGVTGTVEIYYSVNAGVSVTLIASGAPNTGSYTWQVPNSPTQQGLIIIGSTSNTNVYDFSNSLFTIGAAAQLITVLSPNGGEVWTAGSTQNITWNTTGLINYVEIWYSLNNGTSWTYIDDYSLNDGIYEWTLPSVISTSALIKINDVANTNTYDLSDAIFEISAAPSSSITVLTPNGAEVLIGGTNYDITWLSTGIIDYVEIWYSTDGGTNWNYIDDYSPNDGIYSWNVANVSSTNALIKIHEVFNASVVDISDNVFTINAVANIVTVIAPNGAENLTVGDTYNITWSSTGSINYVEIWYSIDGGTSWIYIDDYAINDGIYEWNVPTSITSEALVKINDVSNSGVFDVSDAFFSISQAVTGITVITPNGGENLIGGSSYDITWSSTVVIPFIEIHYSTDGIVWNSISNYQSNDGIYSWTVPNITSTDTYIKVFDQGNLLVTDISDSTFSITSAANAITLLTPNGGEVLGPGSNSLITWTSQGSVDFIDLYYSTDNGVVWNLIADHIANYGTYSWNVPFVSSINSLIKIQDFADGSTYDISDQVFEIDMSIANSITVTYPNGGEILASGSASYVSWTTTGSVGTLMMYYSLDNGTTWNLLSDYVQNTGIYQYVIPSVTSQNALIKVVELISGVYDVSDSVFEIGTSVPSTLTVISPNGGEIITEADSYNITWSSTGTIGLIDLFYSIDNATTWQQIDDNLQNTGLYNWTVPAIASSQCLVKVESGSLNDMSDAVFAIQLLSIPGNGILLAQYYFNEGTVNDDIGNIDGQRHDLELASDRFGCPNHAFKFGPNNGYINLGDTLDEVFAAPDSSFAFSVWIKKNGYSSWGTIISKNAGNYCSLNDRQFSLKLEGSGKIRFVFASTLNYQILETMETVGTVSDLNWHHVAFNYDGSVNTSGPDRVEIYIDNQLQSVNSVNSYGNMGNIQNGAAQLAIGAEANSAGGPCGALYFNGSLDDIRLYAGNLSSSDVSILYSESLSCPLNTISITSPNTNLSLIEGSSHNITWSSTGSITNVDLYYSTDAGNNFTLIASNVSNTGVYSWLVPAFPSNQCVIRVEETGNPVVLDESDDVFTIVMNTIIVDSPNGAQNWDGLSSHNIWWISTGNISYVNLYYSVDNGINWILIAANVNNYGNSSYYTWSVPNIGSTECMIRVQDSTNPLVVDESDNTFSIIYIAPELTLTSHNGGQSYTAGTSSFIYWQSQGSVNAIDIYFSQDAGLNWSLISTNEPNDGSYIWTTPQINSYDCLIRLEDAIDPIIADSSDAVFTVSLQHLITLLHPNGGELIEANSTDSITWNSQGLFDFVDIYYSHNSGSNWYLIEELVANDGYYDWNVSSLASASYMIKVEESNNSSIYDISDQVFEVGATAAVDLIYPNGGEVFLGAYIDTVIWDANGNTGFSDVMFSSDGGSTWLWVGDAPQQWEEVSWAIPNINSTTCLLAFGGDTTASYFSIVENLDSINVIYPNGGEVLQGGDTLVVEWDTTGCSSTEFIDFYIKTASSFQHRATVPNTGSYEYQLPNVSTTSAEVRLKIHGTTIYDDSDSPFTINEIDIEVLYPNGGEILAGNDSISISWNQTGSFDGVTLSYTPDNGSHYVLIEEDVPGLSYAWVVPNISTSNCKIQIDRVGVVSDESNSVFTINNVPLLPWDSIHTLSSSYVQYHQWLSEDIGFYNADNLASGVFSETFHFINKTLDGGQTWTSTNPIISSYQQLPLRIYGAWFFDANNGIAVGHPPQWQTHEWNTWSTSDAGVTWNLVSDTTFTNIKTGGDFGMRDFRMLNANVGYANARTYNIALGSIEDVVFLTVDGGITWDIKPTPDLTFLTGGEFVNDSVGFVIGNDDLYKTIDGGDTWFVAYPVMGGGVAKSIDFVNDSVGYAVTRLPGTYFNIIRTTDQGLSWDLRNTPPISYVDYGVMDFFDIEHGLMSSSATGGASGLWRTSNGALTWETDSIVSTLPMLKTDKADNIVMVNETVNYAVISGMLIKAAVNITPGESPANWAVNYTGNYHTISIGNSIPITIDGFQIAAGDYIGAFYDSLGSLACAGYIEYTGNSQTLVAWGDDTLSTQLDGFVSAEIFKWKIWRASDQTEFEAIATYIQPPSMPNTDYFVSNGMSGLLTLGATSTEHQYINLPLGWNLFSTYINPYEPNIDSLCSPFVGEVIIAKDGDGHTYWPQWGVNFIGNTIIGDGYQIKLASAQTLTIAGNAVQPESTPFLVDQGWSFLGYLRNSPAPVVDMLSSIVSDVLLVKNAAGQIYWPQWNVNLIGNMIPGEGYQIKMNSPQYLIYPSNSVVYTKIDNIQYQTNHYNNIQRTGNNMSLGIPTSGLEYLSEIGVYSQSGQLVGSAVIINDFTAISVWGDDETTSGNDGLREGEEFVIKVWSAKKGDENEILVDKWDEGDGNYSKDKISIAGLISGPGIDNSFRLDNNVPNPFSSETEFLFNLPVDTEVEFTIYNKLGVLIDVLLIEELKKGEYRYSYDAEALPAGVYFYTLQTPQFSKTKKMIKL